MTVLILLFIATALPLGLAQASAQNLEQGVASTANAGELQEPVIEVWLNRAGKFSEIGLLPLAIAQYELILKREPKHRLAAGRLLELRRRQVDTHFENARFANKVGAGHLALLELDRLLKIDPRHATAARLRHAWQEEERLASNLRERIEAEYENGLRHYSDQRLDRALESFVRVLNLDRNHSGALAYIQRIEERHRKTPTKVEGKK